MKTLTQTTAQQGLKQGEEGMKKTVAERVSNKESKPKVAKRRSEKAVQIPLTAVKITLKDVMHFSFQGASFGVVKHRDKLWISVVALCRELGLDYAVQSEMIRDNYTCQMFSTTIIKDDTGEGLFIAVSHLYAWLSNLKPGWLKPEGRSMLITYLHFLQKSVKDYFGAKSVPQPLPPPADVAETHEDDFDEDAGTPVVPVEIRSSGDCGKLGDAANLKGQVTGDPAHEMLLTFADTIIAAIEKGGQRWKQKVTVGDDGVNLGDLKTRLDAARRDEIKDSTVEADEDPVPEDPAEETVFDPRKKAPYKATWKCAGPYEAEQCYDCPFFTDDETETWGDSEDCPIKYAEVGGEYGGIKMFVKRNYAALIPQDLLRKLLRAYPADKRKEIEKDFFCCSEGAYQVFEEEFGYRHPNAWIKLPPDKRNIKIILG